MSNLLEEKRKLEAEVESLKKDSIELSDKSMGLEILVSSLLNLISIDSMLNCYRLCHRLRI